MNRKNLLIKNILIFGDNLLSSEIFELTCKKIKEIAPEIELQIDIARTVTAAKFKLDRCCYDLFVFDFYLDVFFINSDAFEPYILEFEQIINYAKDSIFKSLITFQLDYPEKHREEILRRLNIKDYLESLGSISNEIYYSRFLIFLTTQEKDIIRKRILIIDDANNWLQELQKESLKNIVRKEFPSFQLEIDIAATVDIVAIKINRYHYDLCVGSPLDVRIRSSRPL